MSKKRLNWKRFHKWGGLIFAVFLIIFCISGLILNHRSLAAPYSVSRTLLPSTYHIRNYNNGIIKGTIFYSGDRLLAYGNSGIWLTDRNFSHFSDFNTGLPEGGDSRNIRNIALSGDSVLWCAAESGLFRYESGKWINVRLPCNTDRLTDVVTDPESGDIVALTRSALYIQKGKNFIRIEPEAPEEYEAKVSLFKTVWYLHSGALFGLPGRIVVDIVAIIIIYITVTGVIVFILPYSIRRSAKDIIVRKTKRLKLNLRLHDRVGYYTIALTLLIAITGMCLRPPLMVPLVLTQTAPFPGSYFDSDNAWHDKLRAIRFDSESDRWLISTSEGFMYFDRDFSDKPEIIGQQTAPPVSPMGVNVFRQRTDGKWLIGSFSGLFVWDIAKGKISDYFSGKSYQPVKMGSPISDHLVAGYSVDLTVGETVFDYSGGASTGIVMPRILAEQPISLWNFALELHVGRCYAPLIGPLSVLFVFISGLLLTLIIVYGLILHQRINTAKKSRIQK